MSDSMDTQLIYTIQRQLISRSGKNNHGRHNSNPFLSAYNLAFCKKFGAKARTNVLFARSLALFYLSSLADPLHIGNFTAGARQLGAGRGGVAVEDVALVAARPVVDRQTLEGVVAAAGHGLAQVHAAR